MFIKIFQTTCTKPNSMVILYADKTFCEPGTQHFNNFPYSAIV